MTVRLHHQMPVAAGSIRFSAIEREPAQSGRIQKMAGKGDRLAAIIHWQ
jgi:hypothetical protein